MTKLSTVLQTILLELSKANGPVEGQLSLDDYLPNFVVTRSGVERHFTRAAQSALNELAERLFADGKGYQELIRLPQFSQMVRACVADLHADGKFAGLGSTERADLKLLKAEIEVRLGNVSMPFGHAFPATTLGLEQAGAYQVGPVEIRSVGAWLEAVNLSQKTCKMHGIEPSSDWKSELLKLLAGTRKDERPNAPKHLKAFVEAMHGCDAVVSVGIFGLEQPYSREVGRMVARTALDGVSLLARRGRNAFSQQTLSDERLPPLRVHSLLVFEGEDWVGGSWSERAIPVARAGSRERVFGNGKLYAALCDVVSCLLDSRCHPHPQLAMRWAAALEWFAEGCREASTSIAVTKLATSLDVLTCGSNGYGITKMLSNILDCQDSDQVFDGVSDGLSTIVQRIYGGGRSQLLHGTQVDRRIPFDTERAQAQVLGATALLNLLERLASYQGPDTESAFVSMPASR